MAASLRLFGAPALSSGAESHALPFERRSQLLVFLALKSSWVRRAELAALLWPEQTSKLALTNLRKTLFRLAAFPVAAPIEQQGGALRAAAETDVAAFELALAEGRIDDALAMRAGDLLEGFDDDGNRAWSDWLGFERDRLRVAWRGAVLQRLAGDVPPARAVELSAQLLAVDPLDELAMERHVEALARSGEGPRALRACGEFADRLGAELGLAPGPPLRALRERLAAGTASGGTPRVGAAAPPRPPAGDGFIGRAVELRRVGAMLATPDCRLVTLIGPGGIGKTRLARRALVELAPRFADGASYVGLDAIAAPAQLADRIARALGLTPGGTADPFAALIDFLRPRETLLVLDNFEQLTAAAAVVAAVLDACPGVRLLVTSRVRLALAAEHLVALEGLPFPDAEDLDRAESFDAVRFFVQAAQRVRPALVPAAEAAAIADICRQVEGLPLALELAAAWTRMLSCEAIADELRQGSQLLSAADPTQPTRHASIELVFEQSWSMLGASERAVLARLSVFRGGFTMEAARAVAGASLPVLGALADKSLLRHEEGRLSLHPLVRHFAAQRVDDEAMRSALEQAHGLHFHRLLAQRRRSVDDGNCAALQQIETEFENCRVAWRWAVAHGRSDVLADSIATLLAFCDHRVRLQDGLGLLNDAIVTMHSGTPESAEEARRGARLYPRLLAARAHLEYRMDRYAAAQASATGALALAPRDDDGGQCRLQCHKVLGACSFRQGRPEDAKRHFEQALRQAQSSHDPHSVAAMLDNLALVEKSRGDYDAALRLGLDSLAQHRRLDDVAGVALCLNNLAALELDRGETGAVETHLREALALSDRHGLAATRALVEGNLTELALLRHELEAAARHGERAVELATAAGYRGLVASIELLLARGALLGGDADRARARLVAAMTIAHEIGRHPQLLAGVACFAELLRAEGEAAVGRALLAAVARRPELPTAERARLAARLADWPAAGDEEPAEPRVALVELARRLVTEAEVRHAPLIADLRGR